jgi:hypothetical protein
MQNRKIKPKMERGGGSHGNRDLETYGDCNPGNSAIQGFSLKYVPTYQLRISVIPVTLVKEPYGGSTYSN